VDDAMIVTVDLGTSVTKVVLWGDDGPLASGRAEVATRFADGGRVEQDARDWWTSTVDAMADAVRGGGASVLGGVDAMCLSAARQSFVPVDASLRPIGPGLVWSDRRATAEALALAASFGGAESARQATGMVLDGAAMAAKIAWLAVHQPERLSECRWLLSPRDLVVWHLTGAVVSDVTMASASGLYDPFGEVVAELAGPGVALLPDAVASTTVVGELRPRAATALGLRPGVPVVVGAGDRACEVLGADASDAQPMVSWGTTANVTVPTGTRPDPVPDGVVVTTGALGGWQIEGGLSAAGSFLAWLGRVSGSDVDSLVAAAGASPPGARGVTATPWLGGARAPWWRDAARGAFVGIDFDHDLGDLARAAIESVAYDVARCLESISRRPDGHAPQSLAASGQATRLGLWVDVLAAVTGLPVIRRRWSDAASCGAAVLASRGVGLAFDRDHADPVVGRNEPGPSLVERYRELRRHGERVARGIVALAEEGPEVPEPDQGPERPELPDRRDRDGLSN